MGFSYNNKTTLKKRSSWKEKYQKDRPNNGFYGELVNSLDTEIKFRRRIQEIGLKLIKGGRKGEKTY